MSTFLYVLVLELYARSSTKFSRFMSGWICLSFLRKGLLGVDPKSEDFFGLVEEPQC